MLSPSWPISACDLPGYEASAKVSEESKNASRYIALLTQQAVHCTAVPAWLYQQCNAWLHQQCNAWLYFNQRSKNRIASPSNIAHSCASLRMLSVISVLPV